MHLRDDVFGVGGCAHWMQPIRVDGAMVWKCVLCGDLDLPEPLPPVTRQRPIETVHLLEHLEESTDHAL